ncbi:hypothetical protein PENSUB_6087 [Penicillium subrubescens]|uniref:Uncharacterized protein n=1 Tax=Penicillium subrubescens TaxID=1316194 RepID=A0A1Q5U4U0_9EURO|nr:hypothetical protein PENSUB_6087 [Penicillium subrubescens]
MVFEGRITTKSPPPELALNLLRANKQIHDEARSVLYSQNTDDDDGFVDNDVKFDGEYEVDDDSDFWRRPADLRAETRSRRGIRKKS